MTIVQEQAAVFLCVGHLKRKAIARDRADISHLPTALTIERGLVEHDQGRFFSRLIR